jgi:hypothetical protein
MDSELEKIDIIRSRFNVGYEDARKALTAAQGDVVGALAEIEKDPPKEDCTDLLTLGAELVDEVQRIAAAGPIRRVKIKYGSKLLAEKPVALTAALALAVGVAAVLISRLVIEVDRGEEEADR